MKFPVNQSRMLQRSLIGFVMVLAAAVFGAEKMLEWESLPGLPDPIGVAGPFVGVHNDALIVAGGANFPVPEGEDLWEVPKVWLQKTWVLARKGKEYEWKSVAPIDKPTGYGMCVSTKDGLVCLGGNNGEKIYDDVFRFKK